MNNSFVEYCSSRKHFLGYLVLLLSLSYFSIFYKLDRLNLRPWDESSYALNAVEMIETKDYINLYQFGKNDFYNTKPPFAIWCMVGTLNLVGFNELGVRLPSAIFALGSVLLIFFFIGGFLKDPLAGFFSGCILISGLGFVTEHSSRTGDTDTIVAFWILFYTLCFFLSKYSHRNLFIYLGFAGLTFACLTKGMSGILAMPAVVIFFIIDPIQRKKLLKPHLYIGGLLFLFVIVGYYLWREQRAPGFLNAMYDHEWGGRMVRQEFLNNVPRGFEFYYTDLIKTKYSNWYIWLTVALCSPVLFFRKKLFRFRVLYFTLAFLSAYTLISLSATKNEWYDVPLYPLAALLIGVSLLCLITSFSYESRLISIFIFLFSFIPSYYTIIDRNANEKEISFYGSFLKEYRRTNHKEELYFINSDCLFALKFYLKEDHRQGFKSREVYPDYNFKAGDRVVVFKAEREFEMNRDWQMQLLYVYQNVKVYEIKGSKS